ncbi:hypothetical protein [Streptomyces barringtoniae]|uniref:hypothetical protein n=1 Tax=Streptomyces barringtoniae TaxID=2892029 RepID=UPI001E500C82|nr:hypothetical protein [Streptomyces barringtoniae]MCC5474564.1 hypothetical protein [Streptomyces barringtoniae]
MATTSALTASVTPAARAAFGWVPAMLPQMRAMASEKASSAAVCGSGDSASRARSSSSTSSLATCAPMQEQQPQGILAGFESCLAVFSLSYSRHSQRTCSRHHGVRYWFK